MTEKKMNSYLVIEDTDLKVSRIVLGTANAGLAWDGPDAFNLLDTYVARGGNVIDTARVYSDWVEPEIGRSERVIGDWLRQRGHHDDLVIMTKGAHPRFDAMTTSRLSKTEVESDLNLSLNALSIDCVDIYCFHRDDVNRSVEELIETMESFRQAGKIRYYACSNWSVQRMEQADAYCARMGYRGFVLNQALYNYAASGMKPFPDETMVTVDPGMLEYHASHPRNVLAAYMSLCSGFFHALQKSGVQAVENSPYCTSKNLELYEKVKTIAADHHTGITQVLIGFVLTRKPEMLALIGARNLEQLEAAMDSLNVDLGEAAF
jgi:aryl-alcohol dehydrogenase-like predicted oxidoreductase